MKKRCAKFIAAFTAATMVVCNVQTLPFHDFPSITASAVDIIEAANGYKYYENSDGTITIYGYTGTAKDLVIPSSIDGKKATRIAAGAFKNSEITSVKLPSTIIYIGKNAFDSCEALKSIELNEGLEEIDFAAFEYSGLEEVTIPTTIKKTFRPFLYCRKLKKVTFADGLKTIPDECAEQAEGLEEAVIPKSVTAIGEFAFQNCNKLDNIILHEELESIANGAFRNIKQKEFTLPSTLKTCDSGFPGAEKIIFAEGTVTIPDNCLKSASYVKEIVLPDTVKTIGQNAFYYTTSLRNIKLNDGLELISNEAFSGSGIRRIEVPESVTGIGSKAFSSCKNLKTVNIKGKITMILASAFAECPVLEKVVVPDSVNNFGLSCFSECRKLSEIEFSGEAKIGQKAFYKCFSLKDPRFVHQEYPASGIKATRQNTVVDDIVEYDISFDVSDNMEKTSGPYTLRITAPTYMEILTDTCEVTSGSLTSKGMLNTGTTYYFATDSGSVHFAAKYTKAGNYNLDTELEYKIVENGASNTISDALDSLAVSVNGLNLNVPRTINTKDLTISGTGPKNTAVDLYMNDKLIASPVTDGNGVYLYETTLPDTAKDGDTFSFCTKFEDVSTGTFTVTYSPALPAVRSVRLRSDNFSEDPDITDAFTKGIIPVVRAELPGLVIDISNSDLVSEVYVSDVQSSSKSLVIQAAYDSENDVWVAKSTGVLNELALDETAIKIITRADKDAGIDKDTAVNYYSYPAHLKKMKSTGTVYNVTDAYYPVTGAEVSLYQVSEDGTETLWNPSDLVQLNPQISDNAGHFAWLFPDYDSDWRLVCNATGFKPYKSEIFSSNSKLVGHDIVLETDGNEIPEPETATTATGNGSVVPTTTESAPDNTDTAETSATETETATTTSTTNLPSPTTAESVNTTTAAGESNTDVQPTATEPVSTTPAELPVPDGTPGDANGDGLIDASDASEVLLEYARIATGAEPVLSKYVADVNGDGRVDSSDATLILAYYAENAVGGETSFEDFIKNNI